MNCVTATAPEVVTPMKLEMTPQVEERPGCLRSMLNGIAKFWSVVWEKGCLLFQATTMLFFRAIS